MGLRSRAYVTRDEEQQKQIVQGALGGGELAMGGIQTGSPSSVVVIVVAVGRGGGRGGDGGLLSKGATQTHPPSFIELMEVVVAVRSGGGGGVYMDGWMPLVLGSQR